MYKVLDSFGYTKDFIKWVKLFNTDINAYVLQCGYLSDKISIERGCRQGDPISAYLFLLGAEILSLMIISNPDIVGIVIGENEFKLVRFADDTTLMLDGTQHSLQSALNTLEIYGTLSGLRMNKEKTKLIWIGRKKLVKEKLKVSEKLSWGETHFSLLGLEFSTSLAEIPSLNYAKALAKIKLEINKWKPRHLTPFGKITVIKTNILSKCIHLLTSIQTCDSFLNATHKLIFNFLWDDKPDKVKRSSVIGDYTSGGLKMIDIYNFERSLKVSWIKRIMNQKESLWNKLFHETYKNANNFIKFGDRWCSKMLPIIKNPFWIDVCKDWSLLCQKQQITTNSDILQSCIWYNSKIFKNTSVCFSNWLKRGIYFVGDILSSDGKVMEKDEIELKYNFTINYLNYFRVRSKLKEFLKQYWQEGAAIINFLRPSVPTHLKPIIGSKQGCKIYYDILRGKNNLSENISEKIWKPILQQDEIFSKDIWTIIYKICFKTTSNNYIIWFQYRVLYNILGTKEYLHKLKLHPSQLCSFCSLCPESIKHLFSECEIVSQLWGNVQNWILNKLRLNITLNTSMKILGYLIQDSNFWPLNFVLLTTRNYIFQSSRKNHALNIYALQLEIKRKYIEQQMLEKMNWKEHNFSTKWNIWNKLFDGI